MWGLLEELVFFILIGKYVNNMEMKLVNGLCICLKGVDRLDMMCGVFFEYFVMDEYVDMK